MKKVQCWVVFQCNKKECPAFKSRNLRCWLFSGTHCRDEIQGKFIDKIEMCLDCKVFKTNMDIPSVKKSCEIISRQMKEYTKMLHERDRELEKMSMELAIGLPEAFEALKKISIGDPSVRISETSEVELIGRLKHIINLTAEDIREIVARSHEFAMGLAEHFDVLHRVTQGDLSVRVTGKTKIELLKALRNVTNEMIVSIDKEITERKIAEEALRESEKKYIDLYQNAPDGYHSLSSNEIILEVNNTWLRMLGYERNEVVGKMKITELLTEDGIMIFHRTFSDLKQKGFIENIDYSFKRKDGTLLPVLVNATAIYDEKGEFVRSRAIVRDNSEKKAYEKKLVHASEEWRATFDSMPYGVMLLDSDVNIIRANNYIAELYNIPIQKISGENCCALNFGSNLPIDFCTMLQSKTAFATETLEYLDTNSNKYFMIHGTPILDEEGLVKAYVLSVIDITDMKEKEKKLLTARMHFLICSRNLILPIKKSKDFMKASPVHSSMQLMQKVLGQKVIQNVLLITLCL